MISNVEKKTNTIYTFGFSDFQLPDASYQSKDIIIRKFLLRKCCQLRRTNRHLCWLLIFKYREHSKSIGHSCNFGTQVWDESNSTGNIIISLLFRKFYDEKLSKWAFMEAEQWEFQAKNFWISRKVNSTWTIWVFKQINSVDRRNRTEDSIIKKTS